MKIADAAADRYIWPMIKTVPHPDIEAIDAATVFAALSEPTRLAICLSLADNEELEARCGSFQELGTPSNLTYHFTRLRDAGITRVRLQGTSRFIRLRRDDLDRRFPGLLDAVLDAARRSRASLPAIDMDCDE
ncbi:MAG: ArsR/SmtB family transcription factor [Phreatobacter sp.]